MLRKVGLVSTLLLALPAFAHAWTVTAKIGSGQGAVTDGTKVISLPVVAPATGSLAYYKAENVVGNTQTFTVTPGTGYSVSSVIVNGAPATADINGNYVIGSGSPIKSNQSLVVYFKQNLLTVTAIQPATTQGRVIMQSCDVNGNTFGSRTMDKFTNVKLNASGKAYVKVTVFPNADYKVASIKVNGVDDTTVTGLQGDIVSKVVEITGATDITATFNLASIVKPIVVVGKYNVLPGESVLLDASKTTANVSGVTYAFAATPSTGVTITPVAGTATAYFKATTAGQYQIALTATAPDLTTASVNAQLITVSSDNSCTTCHNNRNAALMTAVQSGKHSYGIATGHDTGTCARCHTTEAYKAFAAQGVDFGAYNPTYTTISNVDAAGNRILTTVGCYACHNNHDSVLQSTPASWDPKPVGAAVGSASQQYKLCTSCHNLLNASGTPIASGLTVSGTATAQKTQHYKDWYRNIASTHYDLPTTGVGLGTTYIEGYNVRWNKASACTDCHGHDFNVETGDSMTEALSIQTQWAKSGHAGKLLSQKWAAFALNNPTLARNQANNAAVMGAGVTGDTGAAWEHYNWDANDRQACQKCHTSTGVSNYLNAVNTYNQGGSLTVAYDQTKNDFSHLQGWTTTGSNQNEMLYCWGCHSDAGTGALRANGKMVLDYKAATTDTKNIEVAVAGKGAVCVSCHAGRGNVTSLMGAAVINPAAVLSSTTTPKNSATATATHYLNAGATIFQADTKVGYQFPGLSYANPSYYKHNTIGCNDCHMPNKNHEFEVVKKDANDNITALVATNCVTCHTGAHGTALIAGDAAAAAFVEEEAAGYKQALAAFNAALIAQGYTWTSSHPYFTFTGAQAALKWRTQGDLGAGHNYNYLLHEPGAYAHNRLYAKRIIFDSIDWLDNNTMNGSININADLYPEAAVWFGAPVGTTGTYAASRP